MGMPLAVNGRRIKIKMPKGDIRGHPCPCFTAKASCGPLEGTGSAGEYADLSRSGRTRSCEDPWMVLAEGL